jgi:glutamate N-acetyltransferase/amino-acid N-acetyltransferase
MTTDLVPKAASEEVVLEGGTVTIVGVAKGSGMIHPNMATMFGFIFTDVSLNQASLQNALVRVSDDSFNMISVDGETSPCDTVLLFANGASGVRPKSSDEFEKLQQGFLKVAQKLAIAIAKDGEGATKLITVHVKNAYSRDESREAARAITTSPLIKSAIHGEDPNWGRILSRLGQAGIRAESFDHLSVDLQGVRVFSKGKPEDINRDDVREKLKSENILIEIDLGNGTFEATAWGCDLTKRYVEINTAYS